jgi:hypothetical protein
VTSPYPARPMDGGVRGAGEEAVGVEERAQASERDADRYRGGDAGPAGQRLPSSAAAHQGRLAPAGHLPLRGRLPPPQQRDRSVGGGGGRLGLEDSFPRGEEFGLRRVRDGDARFLESPCFGVGRPDGGRRTDARVGGIR